MLFDLQSIPCIILVLFMDFLHECIVRYGIVHVHAMYHSYIVTYV